jgi:aminopeptidase N
MVVSRVEVNDSRATFTREGEHELVITPRKGIRRGKKFEVEVEYAGNPKPVVDPDESIEGWVPTHDGAFVVNEPQGSPGWYPVNDTPRDKAAYDIRVSVPEGKTVIGNGELVSRTAKGRWTTWGSGVSSGPGAPAEPAKTPSQPKRGHSRVQPHNKH